MPECWLFVVVGASLPIVSGGELVTKIYLGAAKYFGDGKIV